MIQSLRPMNATPIRNNTSFGDKATESQADFNPQEIIEQQRKAEKRMDFAKNIGGQFVAGAIFNAIVGGCLNAFSAAKQLANKVPMKEVTAKIPLKTICSESMVWGVIWAVAGAVFTGINNAKKDH